MSDHPLEEILHPRSVAVVGSSNNSRSRGYAYTHHLLDYGFRGKIYPVNPRYEEILGLRCYPSLREIPGPVDFVISCVPASMVPGTLADGFEKRVKGIHLYTARFSETGRPEAADLEKEVLSQARNMGIRLIGPNCMGIYYPREGIAFAYGLPRESGPVGFISQTGGGAAILVNIASMRGIGFSKVISYGNGLDLDETDYLDYFAQDPETDIILMYVEGVRDGARFLRALKRAAADKPVIVAKGGRGKAGAKATTSHTASLAGSIETWESAVAQAGAVSVRDLEEMTDLAVLFRFLSPIQGTRVGISGGGGGPSVLAADTCEEAGLHVIPLPDDIRDALKTRAPDIWDWVGNPTDVSILGGFGFSGMNMLELMAEHPGFDLLIGHITEVPLAQRKDTTARLMGEARGYAEIKERYGKPLLVVLGEKNLRPEDYDHWRWRLTGDVRRELLSAGIPIFPTIERGANAASKMLDYFRRRR